MCMLTIEHVRWPNSMKLHALPTTISQEELIVRILHYPKYFTHTLRFGYDRWVSCAIWQIITGSEIVRGC